MVQPLKLAPGLALGAGKKSLYCLFLTWFVIAHVSTIHPLIQLDNAYLGVAGGLSISGGIQLAVEKLTKAFVKLKQQTQF